MAPYRWLQRAILGDFGYALSFFPWAYVGIVREPKAGSFLDGTTELGARRVVRFIACEISITRTELQ